MGKITFDDDMADHIARLKDVSIGVQAALTDLGIEDVSLTVDILEQDGFEYHRAFGFTLFSSAVRGELGRGGCYNIHFGKSESTEIAKGFTLYMDTIAGSSITPPSSDKLFVRSTEAWSVILDLQAQGWTVIRGIGSREVHEACTHIYENGKISKLV